MSFEALEVELPVYVSLQNTIQAEVEQEIEIRVETQSRLNNAASILCKTADWRAIDWRGLDAAIVAAVLAQTPGAPSTRNKMLSALKGVARAAFRLNVLSSGDYHRIRDLYGKAQKCCGASGARFVD